VTTITTQQALKAAVRRTPSRVQVALSDEGVFYLTGGVLAASIVLGGGTHSGFLGDVLLQALSVPLLCAALYKLFNSGIRGFGRPLIFAAVIVAVPLVQLIPLPAAVWAHLPGREVISETFNLIHKEQPLLPLTMSPSATWLSALALLPPLSIFLGCLTLSYDQRRSISILLIAVALLSVLLGFLQLAQGRHSALRFFAVTNNTEAVGFFANRNHFAALLYSAMLFASVWLIDVTSRAGSQSRRRTAESRTVFVFGVCLIAFVALIMAQLMTRSRAGLGLSMLGLLGSLAIGLTAHRATLSRTKSAKIIAGAVAVTVMFSLQFALYRILERFGPDPLAGTRIPFARNTIAAAETYMPFGSGLGTFVPVYQMFEKHSDLTHAYANHAHNDLLEVWLETGIIGPILIAIFVVWLARRSYWLWRGQSFTAASELDRALMKAASIVLVLLMLHSIVDYPLRTSAMMAVAAFCCGLLLPSRETSRSHGVPTDGGARRRESRPKMEAPKPRPQRDPGHASRPVDPVMPRPRELWGGSIEWPEAWRKKDRE
jgi:O-antigen ligase